MAKDVIKRAEEPLDCPTFSLPALSSPLCSRLWTLAPPETWEAILRQGDGVNIAPDTTRQHTSCQGQTCDDHGDDDDDEDDDEDDDDEVDDDGEGDDDEDDDDDENDDDVDDYDDDDGE